MGKSEGGKEREDGTACTLSCMLLSMDWWLEVYVYV